MERALPADFDPTRALRFAAGRAIPGLEVVGPGHLERVIWGNGSAAVLRASFVGPTGAAPSPGAFGYRLAVGSNPALPPGQLDAMVSRQFDLDTDLSDFLALAAQDTVLGPLVQRRPGLRVLALIDPFEAAIRAVVGQLISVAAARTVLGRLVARFGQPLPGDSHGPIAPEAVIGLSWRAFPKPDSLAAAGPDAVRILGITRAKATAVHTLSCAASTGALDWEALRANPDLADRTLRALPGVGPWTASYIRLRGLGDRDAFLGTDLGVIKAFRSLGGAAAELGRHADRWRPWRSYAVIHLWESLHP